MLSIPHLIVIFVVALVVFGPEKLPELARNIGKVMAEFRRHTNDLKSTFEGHMRDLEREADSRRIAGPAPTQSAQTAQPPVAQTTEAAPSQPGTVTSKPPNAAALTSDSGSVEPEDPDATRPRKHPGDDPYLNSITEEFGPAENAAPASPESEKDPQRVTDGDLHRA